MPSQARNDPQIGQKVQFIQRLAALVPHPRLHLIRFHGMLAPNARLPASIIPDVPANANPIPPAVPAPMNSAGCSNECSRSASSSAPVRWHLKIMPPWSIPVIANILTHLGLLARAPPRAAARACDRCQLALIFQRIPDRIQFSP